MTQRSNQAVSHQGPALSAGDGLPPSKRPLAGRTATLGMMGAGAVILASGLWFVRIPLAETLVRSELAHRGIDGDFRIVTLGFGSAEIAAIRLGPEEAPDLAVDAAALRWGWRGLTPELRALSLTGPRLRLRIDQAGRISVGSIENLLPSGAGARRPSLPAIRLDVEDGAALIDAPFGVVTASFHAAGVLGRDFAALAQLAPTTTSGDEYELTAAQGRAEVSSTPGALAFHLAVAAEAVTWAGTDFTGVAVDASGSAPLDLSRTDAEAAWRIAALASTQVIAASGIAGNASVAAEMQSGALRPETWRGQARAQAARLAVSGTNMISASFSAEAEGGAAQGRGAWRANAQRFTGLALISENPSATGAFSFEAGGETSVSADAQILLAQSRLNAEAQQNLRDAFPDIATAPIGPTFAQAERALDAAADRFELTLPLTFALTDVGARAVIEAPIEARAANGARLRIAPLRDDAPALVLQWPALSLGGAVEINLSGGGAPDASVLLDQLTWEQGGPFETEGTITIADWRADGASIAAQDLTVRIAAPSGNSGRLDLVGPARITGPVGDGQVRDLVAELDLTMHWDRGWRVVPNQGCLPVRLGGLDVAGLSFAAGAFRLCSARGGALIAADAGARLSGGFSIEALRLNGHMAGPDAQSARLSAANVDGRFAGTADAAQLLVQAAAPAIAVDIDADRTIVVQGERLTADASIGHGSWSVVGAFEAGTLEDPSLPGAVSAIGGRWSAAPEADNVLVRVEAGEGFVSAREAALGATDPRPLFNPVRLSDVTAELRDGRVGARGRIILDGDGHALANFTAEHDIESGAGAAHVVAEALVFDESLQPYEISELARGLIENVRGPASATAELRWTRDAVTATGMVRPNGLSLAMATIPSIRDVRGEVVFDDLFQLTTPPGQIVSIGELNPGIAVRNGRVQFQLLPGRRVAIEQAAFDFAEGILAVAPTTITLGAEETRVNLTLSDVDVAALVAQLNMADLHATGRVEGSFPMRLTNRNALIENGELHASSGGGTIAYVGAAGDNVTGTARVAFDALRSFRYDDLQLTLNGDLSGEIVTAIHFTGENTGQPLDFSAISDTPVRVRARGVPFAFDVSVTAPFRQLARTAAGVLDPGDLLGNALDEGQTEQNQATPSVDVQVDPLR